MFAFRSSEKKVRLTHVLQQWLSPSLLATALLAMCSWGVAFGQTPVSPDQPGLLLKFYDVPDHLVDGEPGSIIRLQKVDAPEGARAWRVIYRSQTAAGVPVAVSGIIVTPKSALPNPVSDFVGYPSFESTVPNDYGIPGLSAFLQAGYVVVATDYQGLGAGQNHEYVVGLSQARNVLDIVRAAHTVTPAGNRVAVLGWSQGGLAALIAGENASYAPELEIVGIAALAPANPASFLIPAISSQSTGGPRIGRIILLLRAYTWAYADLQLTDVFTDIGIEAAGAASRQCIQQLSITGDTAGGNAVLFKPNANPAAWAARFIENAPGKHVSLAPVLVMQGTADTVIPPASTDLYVTDACQFSTPIFYMEYPGQEHRPLLPAAEADFTAWIASRFANDPAPSNCP